VSITIKQGVVVLTFYCIAADLRSKRLRATLKKQRMLVARSSSVDQVSVKFSSIVNGLFLIRL
jgi:hypothetical protein